MKWVILLMGIVCSCSETVKTAVNQGRNDTGIPFVKTNDLGSVITEKLFIAAHFMVRFSETNIEHVSSNLIYNPDGSFEVETDETSDSLYNCELYKRPSQYKITTTRGLEIIRGRSGGNYPQKPAVKTNSLQAGPWYSTNSAAFAKLEPGDRFDGGDWPTDVIEELADSKTVTDTYQKIFEAAYDSEFLILSNSAPYYFFLDWCGKLVNSPKK